MRLKDYYYFLGLPKDASEADIRRAYRQLSQKYHPDKNAGDEFFEIRFRELKEAYETLSDPGKRRFYDDHFEDVSRPVRNNLPPIIVSFSANKIRVKKGGEVILSWQTQNADLVKILPFGLEKASGERVFKVTDFQNSKFHAVLQATNTLTNKSVVQGITITEVFENDFDKFINDSGELFQNQPRTPANPHGRPKIVLWFSLVLFIIAILILLLKGI